MGKWDSEHTILCNILNNYKIHSENGRKIVIT